MNFFFPFGSLPAQLSSEVRELRFLEKWFGDLAECCGCCGWGRLGSSHCSSDLTCTSSMPSADAFLIIFLSSLILRVMLCLIHLTMQSYRWCRVSLWMFWNFWLLRWPPRYFLVPPDRGRLTHFRQAVCRWSWFSDWLRQLNEVLPGMKTKNRPKSNSSTY